MGQEVGNFRITMIGKLPNCVNPAEQGTLYQAQILANSCDCGADTVQEGIGKNRRQRPSLLQSDQGDEEEDGEGLCCQPPKATIHSLLLWKS